LKRIVSKNYRTAAEKVTAELNVHREDPVSTKTDRRELLKSKIHGGAAIAKPLITEDNVKKRKRWCGDHKTRKSENCKHKTWSEESSFTLFPAPGRVYVRRTPKEAYNPECRVPAVKHGGRSVMIWAAISWYPAGPKIAQNGRNAANGSVGILGNQMHPMVQMVLPYNDAIIQDYSSPIHTARIVQSWFEKLRNAL
jgi:hypothetical protein